MKPEGDVTTTTDAVWAEMQRATAPSQPRATLAVARWLNKSMTSASASASTKPTLMPSPAMQQGKSSSSQCTPHKDTGPSPPMALTQSAASSSFSLAKELNRLADDRGSVRKQAALALERHFLRDAGRTEEEEESTEPPITAFHRLVLPQDDAKGNNNNSGDDDDDDILHTLAKPLFKRFNDPIEKVRDVCIRLSTRLVAQEQDLLRVLPYLMPAITARLQSQWGYDEANQVFTRDQFLHDAFTRGRVFVGADQVTRIKPAEPSEEIRLLFLELLHALLQNAFDRHASSILHAYVLDLLLLLVSGLHDEFHEVAIRSCTLLTLLSQHMVSVMKHFTVGFVRSARHLLVHRLARVRLAAIACIQALVACPNFEKCKGSATEAIVDLIGYRDENVIPIAAFYTGEVRLNYFARLDQDKNPQVRHAFYGMIQDWMTNLPDRWDHESRLMPYLLSAVADEFPGSSCAAIATLAVLGQRYEQEHGQEVLEMKQYGLDAKNPSYNYGKALPPPFQQGRPPLGARLYVRGRTRRFLNPILRELENWQSPTRAHAARLLKCVLVYSEEAITVDAHVLLQTLLRVWHEENVAQATTLREIADLYGRFVAPKTYIPLMLARLRGDDDVVGLIRSATATATTLELLSEVMQGSLDKMLLPHVQDVVDVLASRAVLGFETTPVRLALAKTTLALCCVLERRGGDAISAHFLEHGRLANLARVYDRLFELSLGLLGSENADTTTIASTSLQVLARVEGLASPSELYVRHFDACWERLRSVLQSARATQRAWSRRHPELLVLQQLLRHTPVDVLLAPTVAVPPPPTTIQNSRGSAVLALLASFLHAPSPVDGDDEEFVVIEIHQDGDLPMPPAVVMPSPCAALLDIARALQLRLTRSKETSNPHEEMRRQLVDGLTLLLPPAPSAGAVDASATLSGR